MQKSDAGFYPMELLLALSKKQLADIYVWSSSLILVSKNAKAVMLKI